MGYILHIAASSMARRPALRLRGHDFCERPVPHSVPPALLAPVVPEAVTSAPLAVRVAVCWPQKPNAPKWTAEPNPSPLHRLTATLTVYGMGNMFPCDSVVLPQTRYTSTSRISRTIVSSTGYLRTSVALDLTFERASAIFECLKAGDGERQAVLAILTSTAECLGWTGPAEPDSGQLPRNFHIMAVHGRFHLPPRPRKRRTCPHVPF